MAFGHSINAIIKVDNNSASLTDYTDYISNFSFPRSVGTAEVSVLGDTFQQFVSGLKGGTFSINGPFDPTFYAILTDSYTDGSGTTKTFEVSPQGTGTGSPKVTFEAFVTSLNLDGDVGSAAAYSADFQITGTITEANH